MKYDVVTIGDMMQDWFLFPSLQEIDKPNEGRLTLELGGKVSVTQDFQDIGGTAANVAVGLSRLKIRTGIISAIGKDVVGEEIITKLKKEKVDVESIKKYLSRKSSFSVVISYKGERTILVRQNFEPDDFIIPKNLETNWLYVGPLGENYQKMYAKIIGMVAEKNLRLAINPGSIQINDGARGFGAIFSVAKILFCNKEEAIKITGLNPLSPPRDLALNLQRKGVETVIITDGENGVYLRCQDDYYHLGSYPAKRVETTGAGDAFAAGFLAAYIKEHDLLTCLKWGLANSASVVSQYGAQTGLLKTQEIENRLKDYHWPARDLAFS